MRSLSLSVALSDVVHQDDDTIDASVRILAANGGQRVLVAADVTSRFWAEPRVRDYDVLLLAAPLADIDALVVTVFTVLGAQIRLYGTEHVSACYFDFRVFLADHLPPAIAARLDASLSRATPDAADDGTITFSV